MINDQVLQAERLEKLYLKSQEELKGQRAAGNQFLAIYLNMFTSSLSELKKHYEEEIISGRWKTLKHQNDPREAEIQQKIDYDRELEQSL